MSERVIPYAKQIDANYYKPRSENPNNWMNNNQQWIRREIKRGSEFYDVGIDQTRLERSSFYKMEQRMLDKYNIKPNVIKNE